MSSRIGCLQNLSLRIKPRCLALGQNTPDTGVDYPKTAQQVSAMNILWVLVTNIKHAYVTDIK